MSADARALFESQPVAHLATADLTGQPHLVAICFALARDAIVTAVDRKPKGDKRLKRLDNVRANARASVLVDHYEDDWSALWWARADGHARVLDRDDPGHDAAIAALVERYAQYRSSPPDGPVIEVAVERWSSWRAEP
jgi:PPOX class probable F420-dependent enzyme